MGTVSLWSGPRAFTPLRGHYVRPARVRLLPRDWHDPAGQDLLLLLDRLTPLRGTFQARCVLLLGVAAGPAVAVPPAHLGLEGMGLEAVSGDQRGRALLAHFGHASFRHTGQNREACLRFLSCRSRTRPPGQVAATTNPMPWAWTAATMRAPAPAVWTSIRLPFRSTPM